MKRGGLLATSKARVALLVTSDAWSVAGSSASHVGPPISCLSEMDQMQLVMGREGKIFFPREPDRSPGKTQREQGGRVVGVCTPCTFFKNPILNVYTL